MARWVDHEPDFRQLVAELRRLRQRALVRPWTVLLITAVAASGAVARQAMERHRYRASVTFRVMERIEGSPDRERPQTKRRLRQYVAEGIFTRPCLLAIAQRHNLYPDVRQRDPSRAIDAMRNDIQLEVFQNQFLADDLGGATPRSARIRITYTYFDPDVAEDVAQELGAAIIESEREIRKRIADYAARDARLTQKRMATRIDKLRARLARTQLEQQESTPRAAARLEVEIDQIEDALEEATAWMARAQSTRVQSELRAGLERNQLLLRFALVDWGRSRPSALSRPAQLAIVGAIAFLLLLPVIGIAVAAFDTRIYGVEDIRRLGLEPLGHLPAFTGDSRTALCERRDQAQRPPPLPHD